MKSVKARESKVNKAFLNFISVKFSAVLRHVSPPCYKGDENRFIRCFRVKIALKFANNHGNWFRHSEDVVSQSQTH